MPSLAPAVPDVRRLFNPAFSGNLSDLANQEQDAAPAPSLGPEQTPDLATPQTPPQASTLAPDDMAGMRRAVGQGPTQMPVLGPGGDYSNASGPHPVSTKRKLGAALLGLFAGPQATSDTILNPYNAATRAANATEATRQKQMSESKDLATAGAEIGQRQADAADKMSQAKLRNVQADAKDEPLMDVGKVLGVPDWEGVMFPRSQVATMMEKQMEKKISASDPELVKEYEFAVKNDKYSGTLLQYIKEKNSAKPDVPDSGKPNFSENQLRQSLTVNGIPPTPAQMTKAIQGQKVELARNTANAQMASGLDSATIDDQAQAYNAGKPLQSFGMRGKGDQEAILKRATERRNQGLDVATNLAQVSSDYKANTASLTQAQKTLDAVTAFEGTAGKNLDMFLDKAKKIVDSGSPWINAPLRTVSQQGMGSADLAAFNAARQVALTEIAKVTNNPNLTGQLSDTARKEIEAIMGPNATMAQIYSTAHTLKQDMANRRTSIGDQVKAIRGRISASPSAEGPAGGGLKTVNSEAEYNTIPAGSQYIDGRSGHTMSKGAK